MKEYSLGELVRANRPITYGIVQPGPDVNPNGVPLIRGKDYSSGKVATEGLYHVLPEIDKPYTRSKVEAGDVLLSIAGYVGQIAIVPEQLSGANITQTTARLSCDENKVISKFLFYVLQSETFYRTQVKKYEKGSAQSGLNLTDVVTFKVDLPPLPQQRKIANILSTCDEVIEKTEAAIAKYQALKQGMMHDLFTRGIDLKTGKLRPSYQDAPELYKESELGMIPKDWIVEKSIKLMTLYNGRAYSITEWEDKGTPVIRLQNLTGSGRGYYYSNLQLPDNQYCEFGDLLYMWSATFGPHIWTGPKAIYHYHIWKIACIESLYSKDFAYIELARFTEKVMQTSQGSTMAHITKGGMEDRLISVPPLKEQNLISERLNSLKTKIQTEQSTLAKYQQLKAGLMQDLLTGKVEVRAEEEILKN